MEVWTREQGQPDWTKIPFISFPCEGSTLYNEILRYREANPDTPFNVVFTDEEHQIIVKTVGQFTPEDVTGVVCGFLEGTVCAPLRQALNEKYWPKARYIPASRIHEVGKDNSRLAVSFSPY